MKYILAIDQGTTSNRVILFDKAGKIVNMLQKEFPQIYPHPDYVEHDPVEIYAQVYSLMTEVVAVSEIDPYNIIAIGIANQRETTVVWDKITGKPIYNAIVWQCRRTASICEQMKLDGLEDYIKENTGLVIDAYFSATKLKWILDNVSNAYEKALNNELMFGTIDTWLLWKLTKGRAFKTDYTNASRTMLYNIKDLCWDKKICDYFKIPMSMLPEVSDSSSLFGMVNLFNVDIPICAIIGDQQAALFGQTCFNVGDVKNTYGTGCFMLMNTGENKVTSKNGLITTIALGLNNKITYALEGSVFIGGAIIQWLRDELKFINASKDSEVDALRVKDNNGVYIVPAFTGLGAPHWDMYARGTVFGLTRGTNKYHFTRAALESIAYQTKDVLDAMCLDTNSKITSLRADGGASQNGFLMQFQADIIKGDVICPISLESTAMGVLFLALLYTKECLDFEDLKNIRKQGLIYSPKIDDEKRTHYLKKWAKAVQMCKGWEKE